MFGALRSLFSVDLNGEWEFAVKPPLVPPGHSSVFIRQDGNQLIGVYGGRFGSIKLQGTAKDRTFSFVVKAKLGEIWFSGKVDAGGRRVEGTLHVKGIGSGDFTGRKRS